jgi:hypothetical protein
MGAWGPGSFDNDSALDWLSMEFEPEGASAVIAALKRVANLTDDAYLDVDDASAAVAAAEIFAAARDGGMSRLPERLRLIAARSQPELAEPELALVACGAVTRVLRQSELNDLWSEDGADNPWRAEMLKLSSRLSSTP